MHVLIADPYQLEQTAATAQGTTPEMAEEKAAASEGSANAEPMRRRDFLKGSKLAAAGSAIGVVPAGAAEAATVAAPAEAEPQNGKIGVGVNLEFVHHVDFALAGPRLAMGWTVVSQW